MSQFRSYLLSGITTYKDEETALCIHSCTSSISISFLVLCFLHSVSSSFVIPSLSLSLSLVYPFGFHISHILALHTLHLLLPLDLVPLPISLPLYISSSIPVSYFTVTSKHVSIPICRLEFALRWSRSLPVSLKFPVPGPRPILITTPRAPKGCASGSPRVG